MIMSKFEKEYRRAISKRLACKEDEIFFYWKGRVALYALLKAMGIKEEKDKKKLFHEKRIRICFMRKL